MSIKILSVVGARPNFMKVAPLHREFTADSRIISRIVHTGQHYDEKMSDIFFRQLELPTPDYFLGIGGGSHTYQKANVMLKFEEVLSLERPDLVIVVGDVNATAACSLVAVKEGIRVAHVEAGLRSGDRQMPEEINRIITDAISDYLFVSEQSGMNNLKKEGKDMSKVHFVGNVMIDSLVYYKEASRRSQILEMRGLSQNSYILITIHRPSNVDTRESLRFIMDVILEASRNMKVVFPVHPRTMKNLEKFDFFDELNSSDDIVLLEPQGYIEFLSLMENAAMVLTDSGGIQEETTYFNIPCITLRSTTERPVTIDIGSNILVETLSLSEISNHIKLVIQGRGKQGMIPPLWDGKAAMRIKEVILSEYR